jgi:hypothetical protein
MSLHKVLWRWMESTIKLTKVASRINVATGTWPNKGTAYCGYRGIK